MVVIVAVAVLFVGIACCIGAEAHVVVGDKKMTRVAVIVDAMIDFLYLDDIANVTVIVALVVVVAVVEAAVVAVAAVVVVTVVLKEH